MIYHITKMMHQTENSLQIFMTSEVKTTREHLDQSKVLSRKRRGYEVRQVSGSEGLYDLSRSTPKINQVSNVVSETFDNIFENVKITPDPLDRYEQIHLQQ